MKLFHPPHGDECPICNEREFSARDMANFVALVIIIMIIIYGAALWR